MAAATDADVQEAERSLGFLLPPGLVAFLSQSNGLSTDDGCVIYGTRDLPERNETFEVGAYAPGFLAIGDDSGGRMALIDRSSHAVLVSDAGDMDPARFVPVSTGLEPWIEAGCPFDVARPAGEPGASKLVDVFLVRPPSGGAKGLAAIRHAFAPEIPLNELRAHLTHLPVLLVRGITRALYEKRCAGLGENAKDLEARAAQ
jgi:hypothetical protein